MASDGVSMARYDNDARFSDSFRSHVALDAIPFRDTRSIYSNVHIGQ
jgi:hypothetical protein